MQHTDRITTASPSKAAKRWATWSLFALLLLLAPQLATSHLSVSMLAQMGIAIIACLSYNLLLGQGGMLSFGHAVYTGLGAYAAIHILIKVAEGTLHLPVSLIPLVGGLAGMFFAMLSGSLVTQKAGTPFAMITLGMGELVFAIALMFSDLFGGEAGISANRVAGKPFMGITFGPDIQVYYLIAVYTFISVALMFAFTRTPLGRILNAVRDNPERVEFIGYNPHIVRYLAFIMAGFFAGIAGGLAAIQFEIVTPEVIGPVRSGAYLLFTFLGGAAFFFGPIIGGVLMVLSTVLFSSITQAWLLYLGLIFLFMVMYAPGGIASLVMTGWRVAASGHLRAHWGSYLARGISALFMLTGAGALIEMIYHLQLSTALGENVPFLGTTLNTRSADSWWASVLVLLVGLGLFALTQRRRPQSATPPTDIKKPTQRRETP